MVVIGNSRLSVPRSGGWLGLGSAVQATGQVQVTGEALHIGQGGPHGSIQVVETHVGGDEAVARIQADGGANEGAIYIDYMRL